MQELQGVSRTMTVGINSFEYFFRNMTALIFLLILFGIKQLMDADILNYIPKLSYMFRGTPCMKNRKYQSKPAICKPLGLGL